MSPQVLPPAAEPAAAQQQERAAAYRRFDAAFRAYLQNQAEGPFR